MLQIFYFCIFTPCTRSHNHTLSHTCIKKKKAGERGSCDLGLDLWISCMCLCTILCCVLYVCAIEMKDTLAVLFYSFATTDILIGNCYRRQMKGEIFSAISLRVGVCYLYVYHIVCDCEFKIEITNQFDGTLCLLLLSYWRVFIKNIYLSFYLK